jgi:predicted acetyltransferase
MAHSNEASVNVILREADAAAIPVLRRLMQLYLYDLGSLDGWDISAEGLYGTAQAIERFWTEPGRRSFLIEVDGAIAGFALVRDEAEFAGAGTHEISEFFVLKKYRRRGVGERVATTLFDMVPGRWEVNELASNLPAQAFWRRIIGRYTGGDFTDEEHAADREGWRWRGCIQRFTTPGAGRRP